ncbi:MAG TPA: biopolymer transporter ExbD [Tichowtungia sp.]|nr:biopolymer transporter ExbD [Tichowtungia sp.]
MNRNDCEAVLHLHRMFRPRRRTGRGFLTGTVFLDAALLISAFVLATSPFVRQPGILVDLPVSTQAEGIRFHDMVLSIPRDGLIFFNDERVSLDRLEDALRTAAQSHPGAALILEADPATPQSTTIAIYDAATAAGFRQVLIATRTAPPTSP